MLKFSNITVSNESANQASKEVKELEELKYAILGLMDQTLTIKTYGASYENIMPQVIDGKEMFVEALLDILSKKENTKSISHLESLKTTNKDWKSIDDKINEVLNENSKLKFLSDNDVYLKKVKDFLDKYAMSEDFDTFLEQQVIKVDDYEGALKRSEVASHMLESETYTTKYPKNRIKSIVNKFAYRAKMLKTN
jgi:hypothetical protein